MSPDSLSKPQSKVMFWIGVVMSAVPTFLLVMAASMSVINPTMVADGMAKYGYPNSVLPILTVLQLGCVILYVIPQTSVLGAILMTGYLGGAVATHLRASEAPTMAVVVGVLVWGGLFLRDARIRALIPFRTKAQ